MTTIDAATLEANLDDMVYMREADGPACDAMKALSVALRFGENWEIEALLTLSRHQQSALRQLAAH
ncbi:MAG: hypothetical protein BGO05_11455 [Rhizobiales bacterium 63-7]|nr:hypothetical protein [Hyphomicrobiales bacterium]OJU70461.1 MAG: hypothetical protein BGO05_11455 [Rhizobiales bacterium 63-7]